MILALIFCGALVLGVAPLDPPQAWVLNRVRAATFGHGANAVVALRDGRVIVAGDGLYLIRVPNRVDLIWPPRDQDYWYALRPLREGAMALYRNDEIVGVREDGSLAFRFEIPGAEKTHVNNLTLLEDRHDAIWMLPGVNYAHAV